MLLQWGLKLLNVKSKLQQSFFFTESFLFKNGLLKLINFNGTYAYN